VRGLAGPCRKSALAAKVRDGGGQVVDIETVNIALFDRGVGKTVHGKGDESKYGAERENKREQQGKQNKQSCGGGGGWEQKQKHQTARPANRAGPR